ncbi:MAG: thiol reductant ABC exporter subunit CydD [Nocardioides sp.]
MRPSDPRLRRQLAPARADLAGVLATGVVASVLVIAQAWAVTGLVVAVVRSGDVTGWAVGVAALLALRAAVGWLGDVLATRAAATVGSHLRRRVTEAVLRSDPRGRPGTGEAATLVTRGVTAAEPYLTRYLPALVLACVLPPLTVLAIASQDLLSAVIVLLTLPLVPVFGVLVGLATRDRAERQWRAMESLSGHFLDVVRGLPTLVAFRRARAQSAVIGRVTDRYRRTSLDTLRLAFASSAVLELVATLSVALVAVTVGVRLADGHLSLPTALVVLLLAPEAYWPLRRVGAEFHAAAEGVATFEKVCALTDSLETPDGATTDHVPGPGDLEVVDVSFRYPGRGVPALSHLDARIPARGVTVLTGPSGCGKSTLLAVVAGLRDPDEGLVTVGGTPVGSSAWQAGVAWLPQRPHFVAGTVADNLRLAAPAAPDEALWSVLRRVALEERVRALPDGLDTGLDEDGVSLSAGERARLALARVVLADRPWVLLDEPTAHLDPVTQQIVLDTVADLGRDRAVVTVAHDPAVLLVADHVVSLPPVPAPAAVAELPAGPVVTDAPDPVPDLDRDTETSADGPRRPPRFGRTTLVAAAASASGVALTATAGWLIVQASSRPAVLTLLVAIVGVRAFGLARPVLRYVERLHSHDAALRLLADRRVQVYDALVPLVPGRLGRRRGDLLSSVVDDVDSVVDRELRVRMPVRSFALVCLLAAGVATSLLPLAGLVVGVLTGGGAALAYVVARRGSARAERDSVDRRAALSTRVVEALELRDELVLWQLVDGVVHSVGRVSDDWGSSVRRAGRWLAASRAVVLVATGAAVGVTALLAGPAVARGDVSAPMAALLVLLPLALADVALPLADAGAVAARTRAALSRLAALEHLAPTVRDTVSRPVSASHEMAVDGVEAGWGPGAGLSGLTMRLGPGARVAVVGPSGSGKSTLAALLIRFLDPRHGTVRLGGQDLRDLALDDVRRLVGLVDDDPHVFATNVLENVRLARPDADDDAVVGALRQARLGDWVDSLPDGPHTWLGEVSGGERARLALARSFLAEQPVLVLDEPTAHLDHATAVAIATEVLEAPTTTAVVWLTHSPVGLDLVDEVVVLGEPGVLSHRTTRELRRG